MKNLKYILGASLMVLGFASCENFFDEKQLHNDYTITDTRTIDYVLADADYKTIGENKTNIALALSLCTEEDSSAYAAFVLQARKPLITSLLQMYMCRLFWQISIPNSLMGQYSM